MMKRFSKLKKRLFTTFLLLSVFYLGYSQITITGKVSSIANGEYLPGVNIYEKGTANGTITDLDGNYSITVSGPDAIIVFSSIGYLQEEITVGNQVSIEITLAEDVTDLDEVVVIGYGGIKRKELTGAVSSVGSEAVLKTASSDLNAALQGQMAGVSVQASSGAPGSQANIQIRGIGSFSAASVHPLYVIDGVPYDGVPNITPEEIETIDVSKDGATAAVYGTRASNGVIQITTKQGHEGKLQVDYSTYYGIQNVTSGIKLMETEHHIFADQIRGENNGVSGTAIFINNPHALERNNNFQDYLIQNNAPVKNHTLQLSGGNEHSKLSVTTTYFQQDGVLKNSDYSSLSNRINGTFTRGKFKAGSSVSIKLEDKEQSPWGIYEESIRQQPIFGLPGDGNEISINTSNPAFFGSFAQKFSDRTTSDANTINANINLNYEIIEGLSLQVIGSNKIYNYRRNFWEPQYFVSNAEGEVNTNASREQARLQQRYDYSKRWTAESVLTYRKSIVLHNITAMAGYSRESTDTYQEIVRKRDFLSNETQVFDAGNEPVGIAGWKKEHRIVGTVGRLMYNYDERYLFSGSLRYDGSSNFGPKNKRKVFWGTSVGWNISDESFFKGAKTFVDNLKIRASIAEVGNERIPQYLYSASIVPGSNYHFGPEAEYNIASGSSQRTYPNPAIQWETNFSKNLGLDASILNGKVALTVEAYHNSKQDMLIPVDLPPTGGSWIPHSETEYRAVTRNVGNMINKGIESDLKYQDRIGEFVYSVQAIFQKNINKVTKLPDNIGDFALGGGDPILYTNSQPEDVSFVLEGQAVPSFMLMPTDGVIKDSAQLEAYESQWATPLGAQLGDVRYIDSNGDSISDANDRIAVGSPNPEFEVSLNLRGEYKGFDLSVNLFYAYGAEIYNGAKALAYQLRRHQDLYYQWAPSNPTSDIPSTRGGYDNRNVWTISDQWIEDGTYLRIRNITFGYSLPKHWINKIKMGNVRAYVAFQNPFTFTKYTGFDPEVGYTEDAENGGGDALFSKGVDRGNYPVSRESRIGLQIRF